MARDQRQNQPQLKPDSHLNPGFPAIQCKRSFLIVRRPAPEKGTPVQRVRIAIPVRAGP